MAGYTSFVYRGATLMNMLDVTLWCEPQLENFKIDLKDWVKANIAFKPKFKIPALSRAGRQPVPPSQPAKPTRNLIRNFFQQLVNDLVN